MGVSESRVYRLIPVYLLSCKFNSPESGEETKNWFMDALGRQMLRCFLRKEALVR